MRILSDEAAVNYLNQRCVLRLLFQLKRARELLKVHCLDNTAQLVDADASEIQESLRN